MSTSCQFRPTLLHPSVPRCGATPRYKHAAAIKPSRRCNICFAQEQTRERRFRFPTTPATSSTGNDAPPPPPPPPPPPKDVKQGFPTRRALLGGLGIAAVAAGFVWTFGGEEEEFIDFPEGGVALEQYNFRADDLPVNPAEVYANNELQPERDWPDVKSNSPMYRFILFNGSAYVRLTNGGWLEFIGLIRFGEEGGAVLLEARGGQQYTFDILDPRFQPELVDVDDVAFMNELFNVLGNFDDKLKKFDAQRDMKTREPLKEGQSLP